jgi:hypothetical protein
MDSNDTDPKPEHAIEPSDEPIGPSERADTNEADGSDTGYVSLDLEDGEVVIYDPDDHRAWIQSDFTVEIGGSS